MDRKRKVLLIDDEKVHSMMLSKMLEKSGYETFHALSGEEGIHFLRDNSVDIVLLDILMPGISGIGVLKWIRKHYEEVVLPVIMITTERQAENTVEALSYGANDYLIKPVELSVTLARVETHLRMKELSEKLARTRELEALNSLIITYNHEINNPLSIAMSYVQRNSQLFEKKKEDYVHLNESLERIQNILLKVEDVTKKDIETEDYSNENKMIKIS